MKVGMRAKLRLGSGVGSCHSMERACHGSAGATVGLKNHDQMMLAANRSIELNSRKAQIETQSFSDCSDGAYVETRRGMSRMPAANSGMNARLKAIIIHQQWIFPIVVLTRRTGIFGDPYGT